MGHNRCREHRVGPKSNCVVWRRGANLDYQLTAKKRQDTCKAEAKEKKISWPASRKFVSNCVAKAVKLTPAELQNIAVKQAIVACKAEAKGKKITWPANRKFVSTCLSNALKDYNLDVAQLRRELDMSGLRRYTPEETGCLQNVYCEEM
jgi:hypothetical protein